MNNLTLKYEKAFDLKKSFDNIINPTLTVKQNSANLKNHEEIIRQVGSYVAQQAGIDTSDKLQFLHYINSVEFGNQSDFILSQFLYASHYTNSGKIKIEIDNFLVEQLGNTKLDNLYINDLIFPFNSFYLNLYDFSYNFSNKDFDIGLNIKIHGVYVVKTEKNLEFTFLTDNKRMNFLKVDFPCIEGELNSLISTYSVIKCNTQEELEKYRGHPDEDEMLDKYASINYNLSELSHLVFSIILYLGSYWDYKKDRIIENFDYDKLKKDRNKKHNANKFAIKLSNAENIIYLKMTDQETAENRLYKECYKLKILFLVRGHWRKQPIGKKEDNKNKTIWIKPFWKGEGDIIGKTYKSSPK